MIMDQYFKIILASIGLALWLISFKLWFSPQEAMADDVDIKNRLSHISKVVGVMESSMIKIEGDMRFVKRQASISIAKRDLSEKRLNTLEIKITAIEDLLSSIALDVAKIDRNFENIEKGLDGLFDGSCNNTFLCRRKK